MFQLLGNDARHTPNQRTREQMETVEEELERIRKEKENRRKQMIESQRIEEVNRKKESFADWGSRGRKKKRRKVVHLGKEHNQKHQIHMRNIVRILRATSWATDLQR